MYLVDKNFVKPTDFSCWILISRKKGKKGIIVQDTAHWKKRNFTLTLFWQTFRQNNGFTNKITK